MNEMAKQLLDSQRSGVYQLLAFPEEVERAAGEASLATFRIDIRGVQDKKDFLDRVAEGLSFPEWFGANWDALNDRFGDIDPAQSKSGYVFILENSDDFMLATRREFNNAVKVFQSAAEYWKSERRPFWAFIQFSERNDSGLPRWPEVGAEHDRHQ